jgi:hypothetical protein
MFSKIFFMISLKRIEAMKNHLKVLSYLKFNILCFLMYHMKSCIFVNYMEETRYDILYVCGAMDYGDSVSGSYILYKILKKLNLTKRNRHLAF